MKEKPKDSESFLLYVLKPLPKLAISLLIFFSVFLTLYCILSIYLSSTTSSSSCDHNPNIRSDFLHAVGPGPGPGPSPGPERTELRHLAFGIGAAAKHWPKRKEYVKSWWPGENATRGFVFLDRPVNMTRHDDPSEYPPLMVSGSTTRFPYTHRKGSRSALRITRIVSEMVRMEGMEDVRWFVMGDDDTVFFTDNLVRVLRKYDHNQMYYIGSNSETHLQNINFAFDMAFGGGGFAISYPLAKALEKMQDRCIRSYSSLYGSDDRIQACLAELGVPLTKEPGFHQFDVYGNLFGLLAAHPITPLVTIHHLDIVEPLFPFTNRTGALHQLKPPLELDSAGLMQQSICYDTVRNWTISVSWGYAVQIIRGFVTPREMQKPPRTFLNWYRKDDPFGFSFNTRPLSAHPCQKPYVYYLFNANVDASTNMTFSQYIQHQMSHSYCWWKMKDPEEIYMVEVYKKPNPQKWDVNQAPRRDCCRVMGTDKQGTIAVNVGECREGDVIEPVFF